MRQTTLAAWLEWKKKCALKDCTDETKLSLSEWAAPIFLNVVKGWDPHNELLKASSLEAWCEFETIKHVQTVNPGVYGKRWKNHLLRCAQASGPSHDDQRVALEKMVTGSLQWEATALAKKEKAAREGKGDVIIVPGDAPVSGEPGAPTFIEVYPGADHGGLDPASAAHYGELVEMAGREAAAWLGQMTLREKLALGCLHVGRTLADPTVLEQAGCKKSQFFLEPKKAMSRFADFLMGKHPDADKRTFRELCSLGAEELGRLCAASLPPENPPNPTL